MLVVWDCLLVEGTYMLVVVIDLLVGATDMLVVGNCLLVGWPMNWLVGWIKWFID